MIADLAESVIACGPGLGPMAIDWDKYFAFLFNNSPLSRSTGGDSDTTIQNLYGEPSAYRHTASKVLSTYGCRAEQPRWGRTPPGPGGQPRSPADTETRGRPCRLKVARPVKLAYNDEASLALGVERSRLAGWPTKS
jgi:hypothetical protein